MQKTHQQQHQSTVFAPNPPAKRLSAHLLLTLCTLFAAVSPVSAKTPRTPPSFRRPTQSLDRVDRFAPYLPDMQEVARRDRRRPGGPRRFAARRPVDITPNQYGTWEQLDEDTLLWRLQLTSPDALSINLCFARFYMPPSAELYIYSADGQTILGPYTQKDNRSHNRLFTPIIPSDQIILELSVQKHEAPQIQLHLGALNHGYRDITPDFSKAYSDGASGACNVNTACTDADPWRDQVRAVALCQISDAYGSITCTGTLVNNTAQDDTPYFLTAWHCLDHDEDCTIENPSTVAASLVVYWTYEASTCGGTTGSMNRYQNGSTYRAGYCDSDFALLELDKPPLSTAEVFYAGWDRGSAAPSSAATIHHPSGDMKKISVEHEPLTITAFGGTPSPGDTTHLRVADWDIGTTEFGSSGCPLFNSAGRVVGQLHGGDAACFNNEPDWFGRFYTSWNGGGTAATRLRDWLDPINSGVSVIDGKERTVVTDAYEPDDTAEDAGVIDSGAAQARSILPVGDVDWVRFAVDVVSEAVIETSGADGDTRMWLYDENLVQLAFDDDGDGTDRFSRIERVCGVDALLPGVYYVKVDDYGGNDEIAGYELRLDLTPFSAADLTGDCRVDSLDLSALAGQWLTCGEGGYGKVTAADAAGGEHFGRAVAVSGSAAVIGAPYDSDGGTFAGLAYVFRRDGENWQQAAKLTHPEAAAYDFFGCAVAIDGDYAVVGVRGDDDMGGTSGAAFVYHREGAAWVRQAKLLAPDGAPGDSFGYAVGISGAVIAVGAPYDDGAGSAYVYVRSGEAWQFRSKLIAADGAQGDNFGRAVAIDGACLVAGVHLDDDRGLDSGSVWVFVYDDVTEVWSSWVKLTAGDGKVQDVFGSSVAVDGNLVIVGAPLGDGAVGDTGCAYVFERQEVGFVQRAKLVAPDGAKDDAFGFAVDVDGGLALVGASGQGGAGAAYVFRQDGGALRLASVLGDPGGSAGAQFGCAVAVDGRTAAVGAYSDSESGVAAGAVHLFILTAGSGDIDGDGCVGVGDLAEMAARWLEGR